MNREDFDRKTDRHGTMSLKYDFNIQRGKPEDALQLWVADMDFGCPECVREELKKVVEAGIFGYTEADGRYYQAVLNWFEKHYGWKAKADWIIKTPGVVFALAQAVKAYTAPGDGVLIESPVYYPFYEVIRDNDRKIVENPLVLKDGHYEIDFEDLEKKIAEENIKLMFLCSPHNPVGRVWTKEELEKIGKIIRKYQVILVSDEIHCDLVRPGFVHHVFPEAVKEAEDQVIVCTAPSKTFNLAGLQVSNIFIKNPSLRAAFKKEVDRAGYSQLNMPGLIACRSAYEGGEAWLETCKEYLWENLEYLKQAVETRLPGVKLIEPEGTYFAWLDFRSLGKTPEELRELVLYKAKLWLDDGDIFGEPGYGFERVAYACQRSTLEEAVGRLETILKK